MPLTGRWTLTRYLIEQRRRYPEASGELNALILDVALACKALARIVSHGPWWLDPRPELVSPEMVIFATRAIVPDTAVMAPMPAAREDVMRLMPR